MGFVQEAYVAYGVYIPEISPHAYSETAGMSVPEQVDQALSVPTVKTACPEVSHLSAGDYDEDKFFLVTKCDSAELGEYIRITPGTNTERWDCQLTHFIEIMGWSKLKLEPPTWFVVADLS